MGTFLPDVILLGVLVLDNIFMLVLRRQLDKVMNGHNSVVGQLQATITKERADFDEYRRTHP